MCKIVNHSHGSGSNCTKFADLHKKHVRCPGTRKLSGAFKKLGNRVVRMVDEYKTSQTCARCFSPFPRGTKSYRFKTCHNCVPNPIIRSPTLIVTNVSKRVLQMQRLIMKTWQEMQDAGDAIAAVLTQSNTGRLVSKKQRSKRHGNQMQTWNGLLNNDQDSKQFGIEILLQRN